MLVVSLVQLSGTGFLLTTKGDFPGGSVAETLCSQCRGPGFDPWSYMPPLKISHAKRKTEDPTCPTQDLAQRNK